MEVVNIESHKSRATPLIVDGSQSTFAADVIQASQRQLVLVDFWATWCGPCKQLTPILEKAVQSRGGAVRLVKIDIDKNKSLAAQLQIQSVPVVYAFYGGQPVDAFMGVISESEINQFIDRIIGADETHAIEAALAEAKKSLSSGNVAAAAMLYQQILSHDPTHIAAKSGLGQCYIKTNDLARAADLAKTFSDKDKMATDAAAFLAALELASSGAGGVAVEELERQIAADPKNHAARLDLAAALAARGEMERAIDALLASIAMDRKWNDGAARAKLLKIFESLGFEDPRAAAGRKKLSSILFS